MSSKLLAPAVPQTRMQEPPMEPRTPVSLLMEAIEGAIEPIPSPAQRSSVAVARTESNPESQLRYDNRGRVLKSSVLSLEGSIMQPGAYPVRGITELGDLIRVPDYTQFGVCSCIEQEDTARSSGSEDGDIETADCSPASLEQPGKAAGMTRHRKYALLAAAMALLLGLVLSIVIPLLVLPRSSTSQNPDMELEDDKEPTPKAERWLVPNLTQATIKAIAHQHSNQHQAYDWVSRDPNWDTYEDWRKQQRFALMCLFYSIALQGSSGTLARLLSPSYDVDECAWIEDVGACDDGGKVSSIDFGTLRQDSKSLLVGQVPPETAFLVNLKSFVLDGIQLETPMEQLLPSDTLWNFPPIEELSLANCGLVGGIPASIGYLTSLTRLTLSGNQLSSTLPKQLGSLSSLRSLYLNSNNLSGRVPEEIGDLSSLSTFHVQNNPKVKSPVPITFCANSHTPWESMETDWCLKPAECCAFR